MRLVSKELKFNKETFGPEIFITVAVSAEPPKEEGSQETEDEFYQKIGKQFGELLQKDYLQKRSDFILVRHSWSMEEKRVSIEKKSTFDLTNYTLLGMSDTSEIPMEEWVWTEDVEMWKGLLDKEA